MVDITRALGRSITIVSRYGIEYYVVSLKTRDTQYRLVSVILSPALPTRVLWPYDFRDCYSCIMLTGRYNVSDAFLDRIKDINAWTMSNGIFQQWPEKSSATISPGSIRSRRAWSWDLGRW